jgi:hypothetical protein
VIPTHHHTASTHYIPLGDNGLITVGPLSTQTVRHCVGSKYILEWWR